MMRSLACLIERIFPSPFAVPLLDCKEEKIVLGARNRES